MGRALMGTGRGVGERRAIEAARAGDQLAAARGRLASTGATGILINITGGPDLTLHEVNEASSLIQEAAHEDANIIFGSVIDANLGDEVRITVIATGFDRAVAHMDDPMHPRSPSSASAPRRSPCPTPACRRRRARTCRRRSHRCVTISRSR